MSTIVNIKLVNTTLDKVNTLAKDKKFNDIDKLLTDLNIADGKVSDENMDPLWPNVINNSFKMIVAGLVIDTGQVKTIDRLNILNFVKSLRKLDLIYGWLGGVATQDKFAKHPLLPFYKNFKTEFEQMSSSSKTKDASLDMLVDGLTRTD